MRWLSALLLSFIFTTMLCCLLAIWVPLEFRNRLIWVGLSVPLVWALSIFYVFWDSNPKRSALIYVISSAVMGVLIFFSPVPS